MKKNCPMLQRQQESHRGTERPAQGMVPSTESVLGPSPLANTSHPAATQATVQQTSDAWPSVCTDTTRRSDIKCYS